MSDSILSGVAEVGLRRRPRLPSLPATLTFDRGAARTGREVFPGLDALRVLAALMILLYHAHSMAAKEAAAQGIGIVGEPAWWYACIDLFFVMSGFLMVHMGRPLYGSRRGALVFVTRRLVRTPPLYWLYTLALAGAWTLFPSLPGATPIDGWRLARSLLFVPDWGGPIVLVAWTLELEILFYAIFALTLPLPFRWGPWAASAALGALAALGLSPGAASWHLGLWTDPILLDFCLGMGVAVLFFRGATLHPLGQLLALVLAVAALSALPALEPRSGLRVVTYGVAAACLVALATWSRRELVPARWRGATAAFGATAYSLYLSHPITLKLVERFYFRAFAGPAACYGFILIGSAAALGGGWVAYRLVERPLARRLKPLALRR